MKLSEALKMIHSPKGMSTVIGSILSGDHGPIKDQTAVGKSLAEARLELSKAQNNQKNCQSDMAYWGYAGDVAYWHCVCNLFQAAEITGPDNLPDIPCPSLGGVVMDAQAKLERWGSDVLNAAIASKPKGAEWRQYRRTNIAEMRPYEPGEDLSGVSISAPDRANESPQPGDMIARNPKNHDDQWLVAKEYFEANFAEMAGDEQ